MHILLACKFRKCMTLYWCVRHRDMSMRKHNAASNRFCITYSSNNNSTCLAVAVHFQSSFADTILRFSGDPVCCAGATTEQNTQDANEMKCSRIKTQLIPCTVRKRTFFPNLLNTSDGLFPLQFILLNFSPFSVALISK